MEILTVHLHMGRRYIELPEEVLPNVREVMLLPQLREEGPGQIIVPNDPAGEEWLDRRRRAFLTDPVRAEKRRAARRRHDGTEDADALPFPPSEGR